MEKIAVERRVWIAASRERAWRAAPALSPKQEDVAATFLALVSPGGMEEFFEELAASMQQETSWPPADMSKYVALNRKYGIFPPTANNVRGG